MTRASMAVLMIVVGLSVVGCATPPSLGMVQDSRSGLQLGSIIEKNLFLDASQFKNRSIKVSVRNASGDQAYKIATFANDLNSSFSRKGYTPTEADSFGMKMDVNVLYSGQIQKNLGAQFAFLGAAGGAVAGYRSDRSVSAVTGAVVGATIGNIIGSNVTEDTYIVIAEVSLGITDSISSDGSADKVISFGSSPNLQREKLPTNFKPFREVIRTKVAVYAGGRNTTQQQISEQVKSRLVDIVSDSL